MTGHLLQLCVYGATCITLAGTEQFGAAHIEMQWAGKVVTLWVETEHEILPFQSR